MLQKEKKEMNNYFTYPHFELWKPESWNCKINALTGLIEKIGELPENRRGIDDDPKYRRDWDEVKALEGYHNKTNCFNDPDVVGYWDGRGMKYLSRTGNRIRHVYLMPKEAGCPYMVVYHNENYADPFWAMKTLEHYRTYCDQAADYRFGLAFVVTDNAPDRRRTYYTIPTHTKPYNLDQSRMYLDLSILQENHVALRDIDFELIDKDGEAIADPDSQIENFYGHPVLNVAGRTYENCSLTYKSVTPYGFNNGTVDFEAIYRSETGKKFMEALWMEFQSNSIDDPEATMRLADLGLKLERYEHRDNPWWAFVPECVCGKAETRLPLLAVFHFPFTGDYGADILINASFYYYFLKEAAQGECIVLFFPGTSFERDEDDLADEILEECAQRLPVDKTRIYVAGHSHQGLIAFKFARAHSDKLAGVAILNDSPCIPTPETSTEDILVTDAEIEKLSRTDLPTIIVAGCCEDRSFFPINEGIADNKNKSATAVVQGYGASARGRVEAWNRRLRSCRCPEITFEEALAAKNSPFQANVRIGVPSDKSETLFLDGHEHYIIDIKNCDGNCHLRVIAEDNIPHLCTPSGLTMAWSYLRQFARNSETGDIVDLS